MLEQWRLLGENNMSSMSCRHGLSSTSILWILGRRRERWCEAKTIENGIWDGIKALACSKCGWCLMYRHDTSMRHELGEVRSLIWILFIRSWHHCIPVRGWLLILITFLALIKPDCFINIVTTRHIHTLYSTYHDNHSPDATSAHYVSLDNCLSAQVFFVT